MQCCLCSLTPSVRSCGRCAQSPPDRAWHSSIISPSSLHAHPQTPYRLVRDVGAFLCSAHMMQKPASVRLIDRAGHSAVSCSEHSSELFSACKASPLRASPAPQGAGPAARWEMARSAERLLIAARRAYRMPVRKLLLLVLSMQPLLNLGPPASD